jgi:hypothetical protein
MCHADDVDLALDARGGVAVLHPAVVVHPGAADDGVDVVAVPDRVAEALQHDDARAVAEDRARGLLIIGAAMAVAREHALLGVEVTTFEWQGQGDAAGEGHVAEARADRAAGFDDRDHRGRAGRLQGHRGTAQVHLEGDPRGEVVLVVAQLALQRSDLDLRNEVREKFAVGAEIRQQIGVEIGARVDADSLGVGLGRVAAPLHRLPGQFEEDALLGVHDLRVLGQDAEEIRVELVDVVDEALRGNVAGFAELPGILDFILTEVRN